MTQEEKVDNQNCVKLADKVEPKFKIGDWVIDKQDIVHQIANVIENVTNHTYGYDIVGGRYFNDNTEGVRLWTIQDAKDGDVLTCESGWTCIFKTLINDETFSSHCFMDKTKWFCETGSECHTLKEEFVKAYTGKIYPATKEQHDLLFQKMNEAGYMWDAEKKELKKIDNEEVNGEDYGIDSLWHAQRILEKTLGSVDGYQSDDGILEHKCAISVVKKLYKQRPAWSEEDEQYLLVCKNALAKYQVSDKWDATIISQWLENKLKSLRPQNKWKPSELQIEALESATANCAYSEYQDCLRELIGQLKKLREE